MRRAWPVAEIRAAEEALMARLPDGALMQRAAAGLAAACTRTLPRVYGARVVLLVGAGNNGGDALFAGARLAERGARVTAHLLAPERVHRDGLAALRAAGGRSQAPDPDGLIGADLVLDGIVGIGGHGGLRPEAVPLAEAAADCGATVVAVDVPSGVDADTGAVEGTAIAADLTVTFGALKPGLVVGAGAQRVGTLKLVDIGLGQYLPAGSIRLLESADVATLLPAPEPGDDKYTRGVLGIVAGSPTYGGAAVLTTGAALHGGAGMVRYAGRATDAVRARWPEAVVNDGGPGKAGRVQAWAVGPGLGTDDAARSELRTVLRADVPVLVDADAITLLAQEPALLAERRAPTVLTPHDREFARIAGEIGPDRIGATRDAAAKLNATILLKGNATIVAAPDGRVYVNSTGTPWLATAGTGDVLSGCVGAMLAGGLEAPEAAACGAYLHGLAGDLAAGAAGGAPVTAVEVLLHLPDAWRSP